MKKIALYAGSFDPFTLGHDSIVIKALELFDEVVIAIGVNVNKKYLLTTEDRVASVKEVYAYDHRIKVISYEGLTTTYCKENNIRFIVRGVRDTDDFLFERRIAIVNKMLDASIETVMLFADSHYTHISSSVVREILTHNGNYEQFLPKEISKYIKNSL